MIRRLTRCGSRSCTACSASGRLDLPRIYERTRRLCVGCGRTFRRQVQRGAWQGRRIYCSPVCARAAAR